MEPMRSVETIFQELRREDLENRQKIETGPEVFRDAFESVEVRTDVPGVETALVSGEPFRRAEVMDYRQGDNSLGYGGDCALTSIANLCVMAGMEMTEDQVVCLADRENLCMNSDFLPPSERGGASDRQILKIMDHLDIPAHVERADTSGGSLEAIASSVESGHLVSIGINGGVLWDAPWAVGDGHANHQVTVTGACRDAGTGQVAGLYICDSGRGRPEDACRFVSGALLQDMYCDVPGATAIITDKAYA